MKKQTILTNYYPHKKDALRNAKVHTVESSINYINGIRKGLFLIHVLLLVLWVLANSAVKAQTNTQSPLNTINSKTIVFVTGAFVSNSCWDEWRTYFESKGYTTLAPAWPFKKGTAEELRALRPGDTALAALTLSQVLDYYTGIIRSCPEKPILIGHSLGGMMTQILVNRDLAAAGIAIHPAPTKGVIPYEFSSLKSLRKAFGYFTSKKKTYLMSFKTWQYTFTNGMSLADQKASYEQLVIPESKTVARKAISKQARVNYKKTHAPLLITSGDKDHILPAHLNKRNYKKYRENGSVLTYKEFKGRNHFVLAQPTWKEDADYILDWIRINGANPKTGRGIAIKK
jgi:pimeloyl-ACP methyl ester carboxylesterase